MAQYNDPSSVDAAIKGHEGEVGAIIVEPMLGAGGGVSLRACRQLTAGPR